ncbi:MAG: SufD family Fe-S cluster assembly protein [Bacilli bacterium]|jgi:Fe-S cluster assembly protein SufD|nr:SufD family Fe-S cluster assembly protein [Bacilli bacterium]
MISNNYNILVNNDVVETKLQYHKTKDGIIFNIENDCNLNISHQFGPKVIINFNKNVKCFINSIYEVPAVEPIIDLNIEQNCHIDEFISFDDQLIDLKINRNVNVKDNAQYECSVASFNDCNIDYKIKIDLIGENASAIHNVACLNKDNYKKQFDVEIINNAINTSGVLNNFGVVKNSATLIFNGIGNIIKGARKSQAHQESKIITFDENVVAQANPYLIIDEADVEASHAAAVGQMDEEQLYYLQSRGISVDEASLLITYGYLKPILNKIKNDKLKNKLEKIIEDKVMI